MLIVGKPFCEFQYGDAELSFVKVALHLIDEHAAEHEVVSFSGCSVINAPVKRTRRILNVELKTGVVAVKSTATMRRTHGLGYGVHVGPGIGRQLVVNVSASCAPFATQNTRIAHLAVHICIIP